MKRMNLHAVWALLFLFTSTLFVGCEKESSSLTDDAASATGKQSARKPNNNSTSSFGDYNIVTTVSADGETWTYTITKAKPNAKNLSHLIIDLNNCLTDQTQSATFANIVWATVNGAPANLVPTEGSGTGCDPQSTTTNFIKINFSSASSWVLVIKFDRGYYVVDNATGWLKAGTSCNTGTIKAPGCPITNYCSFSQGFYFAPGSHQNNADAVWAAAGGLTIGGINYTHADGRNFWDIDKGKAGDQAMNAFFQLGAVRLSGSSVESQVQAHADIIDAYFAGINLNNAIATATAPNGSTYQYFVLPAANANGTTKAAAIAAGAAIGSFIDANHCN